MSLQTVAFGEIQLQLLQKGERSAGIAKHLSFFQAANHEIIFIQHVNVSTKRGLSFKRKLKIYTILADDTMLGLKKQPESSEKG